MGMIDQPIFTGPHAEATPLTPADQARVRERRRPRQILSGGPRRDAALAPIIDRLKAGLLQLALDNGAVRKYDESEPRDDAGRWTAAADAVRLAPSVKWGFEPDFTSESRSYPQTGPANEFATRTREYPGSSMRGTPGYTSTDIAAYDAEGKIVGTFSIAHGADQDGYFKIAVRPDAQRQGWGTRLLAEATRQGIDLPAVAGQNRYTPSGRALMEAYLRGATKIEKFDPSEPRDEEGRWTAQGVVTPEGEHRFPTWAEAQGIQANAQRRLGIGTSHDPQAATYKKDVQRELSKALPKIGPIGVRGYIDSWAHTSGDSQASAIALQLAAERGLPIDGAAHPWDGSLVDRANTILDNDLMDNRIEFLREMYTQTQDDLKARGIDGLWLYRGTNYAGGEQPNGTYDIASHAGEVNLQPLSSWSVDPGTALSFAFGDPYEVARVDAMWASADRILSTPRTGFGCTGEGEVVVLGGNYPTRYTGYDPQVPPPGTDNLGAETMVGGTALVDNLYVAPKSAEASYSAGLDDLVRNADWPKRTDDTWAAHFGS